jgi:DNA-binding transcriptional MerR regulator
VVDVNGDQFPIGEVARRTGLTVKAVRFYADSGVVPASARSRSGYRLFGLADVARLELVRTLRELGIDLPTARRVTDREVALPEVAAAHAEALTAQIRVLRLQRAVLRSVAKFCDDPEELDFVLRLAKLSAVERRRLIGEFFEATFGGVETPPGVLRSLTPELPDDPSAEQVEAWVELAGLSRDPDFRMSVRRMAARYAEERIPGLRPDGVALVRDIAGFAPAAGLDPASPECDDLVAAVVSRYAESLGMPPPSPPGGASGSGLELRRRLASALRSANDPRWQRYLDLLSVVNGWPPQPSVNEALDWFLEALAAREVSP